MQCFICKSVHVHTMRSGLSDNDYLKPLLVQQYSMIYLRYIVYRLSCFIQHLFHPTPVSSNTCFIQHLFHPTPVSSNICFIQHLFHPTPVSSNTCFIQHLFHPTSVSSNTCFIQHLFYLTLCISRKKCLDNKISPYVSLILLASGVEMPLPPYITLATVYTYTQLMCTYTINTYVQYVLRVYIIYVYVHMYT